MNSKKSWADCSTNCAGNCKVRGEYQFRMELQAASNRSKERTFLTVCRQDCDVYLWLKNNNRLQHQERRHHAQERRGWLDWPELLLLRGTDHHDHYNNNHNVNNYHHDGGVDDNQMNWTDSCPRLRVPPPPPPLLWRAQPLSLRLFTTSSSDTTRTISTDSSNRR